MTDPAPRRRWGQRALIALVAVTTVGTVLLVGVNALLLGQVSARVKTAQDRSASLANAMREALKLRLYVSELGETSDPARIDVQRGLAGRQLNVSIASFPPAAPEVTELQEIRRALARFPWDRLPATGGHTSPLRLAAMAMTSQVEQRINSLRSIEEQRFYSATIEALDVNQRSQTGLSVLVAVVLALGAGAVVVILRRSRSSIAKAYDALKGEVDEREAADRRFRSLVQRASDLTVVTDEAGIVGYVSPAVQELLGYHPDDLLNMPLLVHVEPVERAVVGKVIAYLTEQPGRVDTVELRLRTHDGRVRAVESVCRNLLDDPDVHGLVWNGRDVTDRRALEDQLTYQANHDPLTGLPNRSLLLNRLDDALHAEPATDRCVSVILIDLDGFKNVNDTLGHPAGDELLRITSARLLDCVREGDTAARLGGDEFAVLVTAARPQQAIAAGLRIVEVLRRPFTISGQEVRIGASVGIAQGTGPDSAEDLLRDADIAMYVAKNTGKGRLEVFEPDMRAKAAQRTSLQQQVAQAVDLGEIEVHYQPIIDLTTFRPTTLEALARWRRPDRSLVPPDMFIPIAEETGAIIEIGREVLRQACHAVQRWRETLPGHHDLRVAVNVSVHQVLSGSLFGHVVEALRHSGVPPSTLTLEITENTALEDSARVAAEFARLQAIGVRIAVDDFGSGYSSLGFLMALGADELKIDRTLLEFDTIRHGSLVTAIAELGRTLGLTVVVEGVETPQHLATAREALCDAAQGYHFSRPLTVDAVPGFLGGWLAEPVAGENVELPRT